MSFGRLDIRIVLAGAASPLVPGDKLWPGPKNDHNLNAWATLNTPDVHARAFAPGDASHLYFPWGATGRWFAAAANASVLYAATTAGLRRSTDQGQSWRGTTFDRAALAVAVASDDPMTVAVVDESTRFCRSPDGGLSWPGP